MDIDKLNAALDKHISDAQQGASHAAQLIRAHRLSEASKSAGIGAVIGQLQDFALASDALIRALAAKEKVLSMATATPTMRTPQKTDTPAPKDEDVSHITAKQWLTWFRGDRYQEEIHIDDKADVFRMSLTGSSDITYKRLVELCGEYDVDPATVGLAPPQSTTDDCDCVICQLRRLANTN